MIEQYYTVLGEEVNGKGQILYVSSVDYYPYYDEDLEEFEDEPCFSLCVRPTDLFDSIKEAEAFVTEVKEYFSRVPYVKNLEIVKVTVERISFE